MKRNWVVLKNEDFSLLRLKSYFVFSLHYWARLCVNSDSLFVCNLVNLFRA